MRQKCPELGKGVRLRGKGRKSITRKWLTHSKTGRPGNLWLENVTGDCKNIPGPTINHPRDKQKRFQTEQHFIAMAFKSAQSSQLYELCKRFAWPKKLWYCALILRCLWPYFIIIANDALKVYEDATTDSMLSNSSTAFLICEWQPEQCGLDVEQRHDDVTMSAS